MPGPKLSRLNLWQRHANAVVSILQEALDLMIADNPHGLEPDLNRSLELYLYEAMSRHRRQGHEGPFPVISPYRAGAGARTVRACLGCVGDG